MAAPVKLNCLSCQSASTDYLFFGFMTFPSATRKSATYYCSCTFGSRAVVAGGVETGAIIAGGVETGGPVGDAGFVDVAHPVETGRLVGDAGFVDVTHPVDGVGGVGVVAAVAVEVAVGGVIAGELSDTVIVVGGLVAVVVATGGLITAAVGGAEPTVAVDEVTVAVAVVGGLVTAITVVGGDVENGGPVGVGLVGFFLNAVSVAVVVASWGVLGWLTPERPGKLLKPDGFFLKRSIFVAPVPAPTVNLVA